MYWIQEENLKARCMELLVSQSRSAFTAAAIGFAVLLYVFYPDTGIKPFLIWGLFYVITGVSRVAIGLAFINTPKEKQKDNRWYVAYGVCVFLSGACWGAFLLYLASLSDTPNEVFILIVTFAAIIAGAVTAYSVSIPIFILFSVPLLVPLLVYVIASENFQDDASVVVIFGWYLFMIATARRFSQYAMKALSVEHRNLELVSQLEEQNKRSEVLAGELLVLSNTDSLTGLYNRRYFDERLSEEWARSIRTYTPIALILCDVDHFKSFNDFLGHPEGDKCLERVASVLQSAVRDGTDFTARYGGEEFAIVVTGNKCYRANVLVERIQEALLDEAIEHPKSQTADHVTLSFGVCIMLPEKHTKMEAFIKAADKALYEAKANGRNTMVISDLRDERSRFLTESRSV